MVHLSAQARPLPDTAAWRQLHCSFCGKDADHVRFLAAGVAGGRICDGCCWKALVVFLRARLTFRSGTAPA